MNVCTLYGIGSGEFAHLKCSLFSVQIEYNYRVHGQ